MPYNIKLTPDNIEQVVGTLKVQTALSNIDEQLKFDGEVNKSAIARRVGVDRSTIIKWFPILEVLRKKRG